MKLSMYSIQAFGLVAGDLVLVGSPNTTINDGANFSSKMVGQFLGPAMSIRWVEKASGQYPTYSGVSVKGQVFRIACTILGTPDAGYDTLVGMLCPEARGTRIRMTCQNTSDTNRQWFVDGVVFPTQSFPSYKTVYFDFTVVSDAWYSVSTTTESTVSVTSSPKTWTININKGNTEVYPVFDFKPTLAKGSGEVWNRLITVYNYTQVAANNWKIDVTAGGIDTSAIIKTATNTTSTMAGITASVPATGGTLTNLASTASFPAFGMVIYDTEQISYTSKTSTTLIGITRGIGGTTAATHANPTTVYYSKMLANGDDLKIFLGNGNGGLTEIPRWIDGINTATTKVWVAMNIAARAIGTLVTGINDGSGGSPSTSITLTAAEGVIPFTNGLMLIGTELIGYGAYKAATKTAFTLSRGTKGTTAAAHLAGVLVRLINEMWMQYGDYTAGPHTQSDTLKPVFSLSASTRTSWVYTGFQDSRYLGADRFNPSTSGATVKTYTVDQDLNNAAPVTTPVADMGVSLTGKGESGLWGGNFPFGYTAAAFTGVDKYNLPANTAFFGDIISGESVAIAKNTLANTWQSASQTYTPAATRTNLQLQMKNASTAAYKTRAAVNVGGLTLTLSSATNSVSEGVPFVSLGAEQAIDYHFQGTLFNDTTGDSLVFDFKMSLNQTLEVNTLMRTIVYLFDNSNAFTALQDYFPRAQLLRVVQGVNNMRYVETGVTGLSIIVSYQYRNTANG